MANFCPMLLGRLVPRSCKYSVDRSLKLSVFASDTVDNLKFSRWPVLLAYYDPVNIFLCCFLQYLELHYYRGMYDQLSQDLVIIKFFRDLVTFWAM